MVPSSRYPSTSDAVPKRAWCSISTSSPMLTRSGSSISGSSISTRAPMRAPRARSASMARPNHTPQPRTTALHIHIHIHIPHSSAKDDRRANAVIQWPVCVRVQLTARARLCRGCGIACACRGCSIACACRGYSIERSTRTKGREERSAAELTTYYLLLTTYYLQKAGRSGVPPSRSDTWSRVAWSTWRTSHQRK